MKDLSQLITKIASQVHTRKLENVLELKPTFQSYLGHDWKDHLTIENGEPKNTVLFQDEHLRMILIYWDSFHKSKKHGHPEGGGLIKVLSGTLSETRFDTNHPDRVIGQYTYKPGEISFIHDSLAYHIVENPSAEAAVSLHIYMPGVTASHVIEEDPRLASRASTAA